MARFLKKNDKSKGMAPGSLVFIGNKKVEKVRIRVIDFNGTQLNEIELHSISKGEKFKKSKSVSWINIDGLHDASIMKEVGEIFDLHPLLLEDIMNTGQRPKFEEFEHTIFFTVKMLRQENQTERINTEQLSIVIGKNYLLTFQEQTGDVFDPVRDRIRKNKGRIRTSDTDYLAYALLDTVVDNYIAIIERLGDKIEDIEDDLTADPTPSVMEKINAYKREMNFLRKSIRPLREGLLQLLKSDSNLIKEPTIPFYKDLLDLSTQTTEAIDTYREMLSDQMNMYNSSLSNKMNEIMKVLTIFAAIFIPLTYIAGIYGTNFEYLPELHYKYSYFIFWGVMIVVALSLVLFFKRKKWL